MAVCTKKRFAVFFLTLTVYMCINQYLKSTMIGDPSYPAEMYMGPPMSREQCISFKLYDIDESAKEMSPQIFCDRKSAKMDLICRWFVSQQTNVVTSYLHGKPTDDMCLLPDNSINGDEVVPKVVYYVLFGVKELTFLGYMSVLSVKKFVRPRAIYVLSDEKPSGEWWNKVVEELEVRFIRRQKPKWVGDKVIKFNTHAKNMIALQVLTANGGIYVDLEMLILRSLHPLLKHNVTLGLISDKLGMGNDLILSKRSAQFMYIWHATYSSSMFNESSPYRITRIRPYRMWKKSEKKIHVESTRFYNPGAKEKELMFTSSDVDWSENYAMKVWNDPSFKYPQRLSDIKNMDNTLGQVLRHINRQ